ncbi:major facilitator superfamily domain-containing protein [Ochromonadaceae sp. CCMP2298]|nr:major facilitator superfamily domain-containing protein [Ochromonadaceae sp. CCMP2298]
MSKDPNSEENVEKFAKSQKWVFGATFTNYAMAHWTRKSYTNVKVQLIAAGVSPLTLAAMDSGFMFTYAGGSFITGQLGDHFSPVHVIAIGLLGSTVCLFMILFGSMPNIAQNAGLCGAWFLGTQLLHGLFQATGGPVNTAIMGNWFPAKGRGLIFGLWTCHQYVGDIVAALFSAWILSSNMNWHWCIILPAVLNGLWSIVNFYMVPNTPEEAGLITENTVRAAKTGKPTQEATAVGFFQAFMLPNVLSYAIAFGFFKLVNYAMFFQLPLILSSHFDPATSNVISSLYSVGMMPGGIVCGWVSDLYGGRRACVIATFMAILCPLLLIFAWYMDTLPVITLLVLLAFMGCLVGGPNNIITSAVAADLADDPSIKGNNKALGTVTGIINGSGSITAAIGQLAIPILYEWGKAADVGYRYVWYFLIFCTIVGTSLMSGKIYKELYPHTQARLLSSNQPNYQSVSTAESNI